MYGEYWNSTPETMENKGGLLKNTAIFAPATDASL
jgi:hypothetical protein